MNTNNPNCTDCGACGCDENNGVGLHPLYVQEYYQLAAFFAEDPTITVGALNTETKTCTVACEDAMKAYYLRCLLNLHALEVDILPKDDPMLPSENMLGALCADNPLFSTVFERDEPPMKAALFEPVCVEYYSDDAFSPSGHSVLTAEQMAKTLFGHRGLNIKTDI